MSSKIKATVMSSLEKIYHEKSIPKLQYKGFSMLKNERKSFQLAVECEEEFNAQISVVSDFEKVNIYTVEFLKSDFPARSSGVDDYYTVSADAYYPELLLPVNDSFSMKKGRNLFWIEIESTEAVCDGNHNVEVNILNGDNIVSKSTLNIEVIGCNLDFKDFIYTNWIHTDCLMSQYHMEVFSDEYWRIVKNYLKTANDYGMNCVLTPIFTPPLDTEVGKERPTVQLVDVAVNNGEYTFSFDNLTKWIKMSKECGMEYFEMSHLYTQWGARHAPKIMATVDGEYKMIFGWKTRASSHEYVKFLTDFSTEFKKYIEANNLKDNVLIHVSDEPNFSNLIPYTKASRLVHKLFNGYKIVDALSEYQYYRFGIVTTPIVATTAINSFIGKTDELWAYYCSSQHKDYVANRFFCMPSLRNRVLGYQLYKYKVKAFLHWGYNFWYTQLSKAVINPFEVTDAGGKFPSGDSFVVYPNDDGTPYVSLRLIVFYDALQDMAALNSLEKLIGRDKTMAVLEENGKDEITFNNYPHSKTWLLSTRERINKAIKEALKQR